MVLSLSRGVESGGRDPGAAAFRRVLVVVDGSESARTAVAFAEDWARDSGAQVRIVELAERAPTLDARNRRLVAGITDAARTFGADVVVLGLERRRMARHRFARSFRAQLASTTDLPVMIPPPRIRPAPGRAPTPSEAAGTLVFQPMGRHPGV
jgi:nucleotide-binding universal stress UspA family protein